MNFPLDSVTDLPDDHRQALAATLEHMQVRDRSVSACNQLSAARTCQSHRMRLCPRSACAHSLKMYNNLVERCFKECTEDMRSKSLSSSEEKVCH